VQWLKRKLFPEMPPALSDPESTFDPGTEVRTNHELPYRYHPGLGKGTSRYLRLSRRCWDVAYGRGLRADAEEQYEVNGLWMDAWANKWTDRHTIGEGRGFINAQYTVFKTWCHMEHRAFRHETLAIRDE
jgi:phytoene dehydrogenase-like protein